MQTINNLLLDSTLAVAGNWRDISNFVGMSVHGVNLEGKVWVELSNDPNAKTDGNAAVIAPSAPTLSQFVSTFGGLSGQGTLYVKITYVTSWGGETQASTESSLAVSDGHLLSVASPAPDAAGIASGYNVYVGQSSGAEVLQSQRPWTQVIGGVPLGQPFVLANGYQPNGVTPPSASTAGGPITGVLAFYLWSTNAPATGSPSAGAGEEGYFSDSNNGNQTLWAPSCLYFNFLRVVKSADAQTKETKVWLFGQNG